MLKKIRRYREVFVQLHNPLQYLWQKWLKKDVIVLHHRHLGYIKLSYAQLGPFKENFFDNVYLSKIDEELLSNITHFIDIGANAGHFAMSALLKYPSKYVYSYEPHPVIFDILRTNHSI